MFEVGVDARLVHVLPGLDMQIGARIFQRVGDADGLAEGGRVAVHRNPDHAAGRGGRPAEHRLFLGHQNVEPGFAGRGGGGQPRAARADDEHVHSAIGFLVHAILPFADCIK